MPWVVVVSPADSEPSEEPELYGTREEAEEAAEDLRQAYEPPDRVSVRRKVIDHD